MNCEACGDELTEGDLGTVQFEKAVQYLCLSQGLPDTSLYQGEVCTACWFLRIGAPLIHNEMKGNFSSGIEIEA